MKKICFLILFIYFFANCSTGGDSKPEIDAAFSLKLIDIANNAQASDFELNFSLTHSEHIQELRAYLVKEGQASTFNLENTENIPVGNYVAVPSSAKKIRFDNNTKDINGALILEGESYVGFILSVANPGLEVQNVLSEGSNSLSLQQINTVSTLTDFIDSGSGGMDIDADGNIYMGDFGVSLNGGGDKIFKISPDGSVSVFVTGMDGASGNDFDIEGNLYQSSITGGYISKVTPEGVVSTFAFGITQPIGIVVTKNDTVFVAACDNTIKKITPEGEVSIFSSSSLLSCPNGIDIDMDGNIYTTNFDNGRVIKITPNGEASLFATIPGNNNGHLLIRGKLMYVIARGANQIYTVNLETGISFLFAGTGQRGLENGPLDQATFSLPNDIAISADGTKIYINDKDPAATGNVISPVVIREISIVE